MTSLPNLLLILLLSRNTFPSGALKCSAPNSNAQGGSLCQQAMLWNQPGVLQFNSTLIIHADSIRLHRLRAQSHKAVLSSDQPAMDQRFSQLLSQVAIICYSGSQNSRETFHSSVYHKRTYLRTARLEREEKAWSFHAVSKHLILPKPPGDHQLRSSLVFFYRLHYIGSVD